VNARLSDLLTLQAEERPEAPAVVFRAKTTTYGALEQASNRVARALMAEGVERGGRVALLLSKSPKALAAIFGTLKADAIYVPIDTACPPARIQRILDQCEYRCLLAESASASLLNELINGSGLTHMPRILWMDGGAEGRSRFGDLGLYRRTSRLAGRIFQRPFRSRPYPVHVRFHRNAKRRDHYTRHVTHFIRWAVSYFGITPQDRISGHPPLHFDLSTFDIYGTVAAGAQIHLLPLEVSLLPHRLADFIRDSGLTQWFSVPSALLGIAKYDVVRHNDFPALRRLLWCGEKFPVPALIYFMKRLPRVDFFTLYGPTEATIASQLLPRAALPRPRQDRDPDRRGLPWRVATGSRPATESHRPLRGRRSLHRRSGLESWLLERFGQNRGSIQAESARFEPVGPHLQDR
jgi:non-ribosomal peptide synthetase component F